VPSILTKIDFTGLLFFLGILLAIDALDTAGILKHLANWLDQHFHSTTLIATLIGLASAVVDNVPLVAATMGMYSMEQFPTDHEFWQKIAYAAGTGGSILIIGSAAGVVYMALEKVDFFWYLKKISLAALVGFFAGMGAYLALLG
jgi:Na+/H+ antiporter NhaD/arsenite permease-like protein